MKKIILVIVAALNLFGSIEISQNMKALYKNVELSEIQENYIIDNEDAIKRHIKNSLNKNVKISDGMYEKNVVSFIVKVNGKIENFKFLKKSGNKSLDKKTKKAIKSAAKNFPRPKEETEIRYIIKYESDTKRYAYQSNNSRRSEPYYQNIGRGTTRFAYSSKEYVRVFEVSEDGFANIKNNMCANVQVLTDKNQRISLGYADWNMNGPIKKGNYKLLVKTKKDCDLHIQYP